MVIEEKLRHKEMHLKQVIDEYSLLRDKYQKGIIENKDEIMTPQGVAKNAELFITLIEAFNLKPEYFDGRIDPYAVIRFEGKEKVSNLKSDTFNPVWNEDFDL